MTTTSGQPAASAPSALDKLQEDRFCSHYSHLHPERSATYYLKMKGKRINAVFFFTLFSGTTQLLKISSNKMFSKFFFSNRGTERERHREEDTQYFSGKFSVAN